MAPVFFFEVVEHQLVFYRAIGLLPHAPKSLFLCEYALSRCQWYNKLLVTFSKTRITFTVTNQVFIQKQSIFQQPKCLMTVASVSINRYGSEVPTFQVQLNRMIEYSTQALFTYPVSAAK